MLWIQQGLMPALDCSSVWAHFPRVQVASPSGVAVPSWLTSLSFTGACVRTLVWSHSVARAPYLEFVWFVPSFLTKEVATSILVLTCPRVCLLLSLQFLT